MPNWPYDVGGVSEVLANNITGKLVEFDDEESFCKAVLDLENNIELRTFIIQNAFALISKDFMNTDIKEVFLRRYMELTTDS